MTTPQATEPAATARSPFAGCTIMIIALLVMLFLVVFSTMTLFRQFNAIKTFTDAEPKLLPVLNVEEHEAELNALAEKLEVFRQKLLAEEAAEISLSPAEINLAIAAFEPLKDLRGKFRAKAVEGGHLLLEISFPLNGKPRLTKDGEDGLVTSDPRYLNGVLVAKPLLVQNEVILQIDDIEVPGAKVAEGFIGQFSPYRVAERYVGKDVIGQSMAALTHIDVANGRVVLARVPGEKVPGTITNAEVDAGSIRLFTTLGIVAAVFLVFVGIVLFIGYRAKARGGA